MNFIKPHYCCFLLAFLCASQAVYGMDGEEPKTTPHKNSKRFKEIEIWNENPDSAFIALTAKAEDKDPNATLELIGLYIKHGVRFFGSQQLAEKVALSLIYSLFTTEPSTANALLGWMHLHGRGCPRDITEGLRLLTKEGEGKNVYALCILGDAYESGIADFQDHRVSYQIRPDQNKAAMYYREAHNYNHPQAMKLLNKLERKQQKEKRALSSQINIHGDPRTTQKKTNARLQQILGYPNTCSPRGKKSESKNKPPKRQKKRKTTRKPDKAS